MEFVWIFVCEKLGNYRFVYLRSGWCRFIYVFFCVGVIICFVFLIGYVVVELSNSFCFLCVFYIEVFYIKEDLREMK